MLANLFDTLLLNGTSGRTVLVVEDYRPLLERIEAFLGEMEHRVVAWTGVDRVEGWTAYGLRADGGEQALDLRTVEAALLDHYFLGRLNGRDMCLALRQAGTAPILAMSSDARANAAMVAAGATVAVRKAELTEALAYA